MEYQEVCSLAGLVGLDFSRARFNLTMIDDVLQETDKRNFYVTKSFDSSSCWRTKRTVCVYSMLMLGHVAREDKIVIKINKNKSV